MNQIQKRKQNWIDFQNVKSDTKRLLVVHCKNELPKRPMLYWENKDERIAWSYEHYMRQIQNMDWLDDNTIPYLDLVTGTEVFAEAFGCKVHKPNDSNPCALPMIESASELSKVKTPKIEDTNLYTLFEMADKLKDKVGKDAILGFPDIQTPMDIAALIWEKSDFFAALYEEPEAVKELSTKVKLFMFDFFDTWFARYGKETIAHYPDYYMPFGITMSEDEIGAVSSEMYQEFFEDELNEFADRYGAIGIHCCANSQHQWENLKKVHNLKILNLIRDDVEIKKSFPVFADVCGQFIPNQIEIDNSEPSHIAFYNHVETKEEAIALVEHFKRANEV